MPSLLHQTTITESKKLHGTTPWLWLWRIEVDVTTSATTVLQLARYPQEVVYDGATYYPWPLEMSEIVEDGEANLPTLQVKLGNTARVLSEKLHFGQGLIGNNVQVWLIPQSAVGLAPTTPDYALTWKFHITDAIVTRQDIVLNCQLPNFYQRMYPEQTYNPSKCRFAFGFAPSGCPYVLHPAAAYTTCDKSLVACEVRGFDMNARGYPRNLLPSYFGAFPGTDLRSGA